MKVGQFDTMHLRAKNLGPHTPQQALTKSPGIIPLAHQKAFFFERMSPENGTDGYLCRVPLKANIQTEKGPLLPP